MGLVLLQPCPETLAPAADPTATTPAQTATEMDGIFASLMAALSATSPDAAGDTSTKTSDVPIADLPTTADEKKEVDPFAGLFATTVPLVVAPQVATVPNVASGEADTPAGDGTPAIGTGAVMASEGALPAALSHVGEPASETTAPAALETAAAGLAGAEADAAPVVAAAAAPAETAAAAPASETPPPDLTPVVAGSANVPGLDARKPEITEPKPPADTSPPSEPSGAVTQTSSVVRSVGNAETGDDTQAGNGKDQKERIERPLPQAADQGFAHASGNSAVAETHHVDAPADAGTTTAPQGPDAPVPPQVEHVARTIIERVDNGGGDARIHLDPAGLGEVTIHVHTQGDHVHVEVRAEQREAAQLLRDHTQDLSTLLGERGLTLADVNVGLGRGGGDQTWARDEAPRSRPNSGEFAAILGAGDTTSLETHNRLRAAYNPDGAHMYRV